MTDSIIDSNIYTINRQKILGLLRLLGGVNDTDKIPVDPVIQIPFILEPWFDIMFLIWHLKFVFWLLLYKFLKIDHFPGP